LIPKCIELNSESGSRWALGLGLGLGPDPRPRPNLYRKKGGKKQKRWKKPEKKLITTWVGKKL